MVKKLDNMKVIYILFALLIIFLIILGIFLIYENKYSSAKDHLSPTNELHDKWIINIRHLLGRRGHRICK